ncbi:MAG: LysR family transcriptional regulator [Parasphingorhabdus sp.]|uniref:LysR family transcriptional regulator n=1 Tax=Parasphingorhabdus sp. TaxID=2709688 RepID=UPI0032972DD0
MAIDWDTVRCFLEVANKGSLSAAALSLRMSNATLGRKIDALEAGTGLQLLERGPSGVRLTAEGKEIEERAQKGGDHLYQLERLAFSLKADRSALPIRVSATETTVSAVLAPQLPRLWKNHPQIMVDLVMSTELADLNRREADIAIRLARPKNEGLIARRLPVITAGLYASADYLGGRDPRRLDLQAEKLAGLDEKYGQIPEVVWATRHDLQQALSVQSSSIYALLEIAKSSAAIAMLPDFLARRHDLIPIAAPPIPVRKPWIVFHRDNRTNPEVKAVREWIVQSCRQYFTDS